VAFLAELTLQRVTVGRPYRCRSLVCSVGKSTRRACLLCLLCAVMPPEWALPRERSTPLIGRDAECSELQPLLVALRGGESRSLVIRGEAGVGKTALLETRTLELAGALEHDEYQQPLE